MKCRVVQGRRKTVHYMVPVIELCSCVHVYQVGQVMAVKFLIVLEDVRAMVSVMGQIEIYLNVIVKMVGIVKTVVNLVSMVT